jgi:hypothetical protein
MLNFSGPNSAWHRVPRQVQNVPGDDAVSIDDAPGKLLGDGHALGKDGIAIAIGELPAQKFGGGLGLNVGRAGSGRYAFLHHHEATRFLQADHHGAGSPREQTLQAQQQHLGSALG